MDSKIIKIICVILLSLSVIVMISGCANKVDKFYYNEVPEGYEQKIYEDESAFILPRGLLSEAKEVKEFTDDCESGNLYVMSNNREWVLTNMNFVITVVKATGTIPQTKEEYLNQFASMRLTFDEDDVKFSTYKTKEGSKSISGLIHCEGVLSTEFYNDFVGRMAIVQNNNSWYGYFFGMQGIDKSDVTKENADILDICTKSFLVDANAKEMKEKNEQKKNAAVGSKAAIYIGEKGEEKTVYTVLGDVYSDKDAEEFVKKNLNDSVYSNMPTVPQGYSLMAASILTDTDTVGLLPMSIVSADEKQEEIDRIAVHTLKTDKKEIKVFFIVPDKAKCKLQLGIRRENSTAEFFLPQ